MKESNEFVSLTTKIVVVVYLLIVRLSRLCLIFSHSFGSYQTFSQGLFQLVCLCLDLQVPLNALFIRSL